MLESYQKKRDFAKTSEPSSGEPVTKGSLLSFVIQKHDASHLHYDFRLEAEGVLKSWAVPKGPSMDPKDKHLAVMVEDHPLAYATFEGEIPAGQYGGGQVIVWDEGNYQPKGTTNRNEAETAVLKGIQDGKLHFTLFGEKLHGEFVLTRIHGEEQKNWLLMKVRDEFAVSGSILEQGASVRSGRTIEDIKVGKATARTLSPMLASEVKEPFDDPKWEFELKLDGVRAIASKENGKITLLSRNGNSLSQNVPAVMEALEGIACQTMTLDGELVFFDEDGKASFQQLMKRIRPEGSRGTAVEKRSGRIEYCVFDILELDHEDLTGKTWKERRAVLEKITPPMPVRVIDSFPEHGKLLFTHSKEMGFEGVMAKKLSSKYEPGRRSESWLKIKGFHSEEFVVGGFTAGTGSRKSSFGALQLGKVNETGGLDYAGNVGGGFSDVDLKELREKLDSLKTETSPFSKEVDGHKSSVWVKPELTVEVKFMSRTEEGCLRFPVFLRLRTDQDAPKVSPMKPGLVTDKEDNAESVIHQLEALGDSGEITANGHPIHVSHLSKVLWPKTAHSAAVTKKDLLRYYALVSSVMLPFLKDRPLSFVRHPDGIESAGFFQKHPLPGMPNFVTCAKIWSEHSKKALDWIVCNDLATLLWLGQVGSVEIHPWYSRITSDTEATTDFSSLGKLDASILDYPDFVVFDLDPNIDGSAKSLGNARAYDKDAWRRTAKIALLLREMLSTIHLESWVKTSGKTGIHVYVPIKRQYHYDEVKSMAEVVGRQIEKEFPTEATMVWSVKNRPQAVFIDHNQNVRGKTLAAPFSPRVAPGASVSFPVSWERLTEIDPSAITIATTPAKLAELGNSWSSILSGSAQELLLD
jgi:bifunctional non-homologous end joining protein LigD